jgi:hypothetical protein
MFFDHASELRIGRCEDTWALLKAVSVDWMTSPSCEGGGRCVGSPSSIGAEISGLTVFPLPEAPQPSD